jgi:hypothetical protein
MDGFGNLLGWAPVFLGVCAAGFLIIGIGGMLKRKWARREFDAIRKRYQETDVTDPQYNAVRALYISALINHNLASGSDRLTENTVSHAGEPGADSGGGDSGGGGD